jgi:hypothetical protein
VKLREFFNHPYMQPVSNVIAKIFKGGRQTYLDLQDDYRSAKNYPFDADQAMPLQFLRMGVAASTGLLGFVAMPAGAAAVSTIIGIASAYVGYQAAPVLGYAGSVLLNVLQAPAAFVEGCKNAMRYRQCLSKEKELSGTVATSVHKKAEIELNTVLKEVLQGDYYYNVRYASPYDDKPSSRADGNEKQAKLAKTFGEAITVYRISAVKEGAVDKEIQHVQKLAKTLDRLTTLA